jgi:peptidoglycan/xylan/chitin deacetylase (PgdA/CDA1 family)
MNTLFAHIPKWLQGLLPGLVWRVRTKEKELYLTFDDGPTPEITEWTLDLLKKYGAKATFFCLGRNCVAYPLLFQKITAAGHRIGNHSFDHKKGWKTSTHHYVQNILKAEETYKE